MEEMLKEVDVDDEDVDTVARRWIDDHAGQIEAWVG